MNTDEIWISITRLKWNSPWKAFVFYRLVFGIIKQLKGSKGLIKYQTRYKGGHHYTLSFWSSKKEKVDFAYSGAHKYAIQIFKKHFAGRTYGFSSQNEMDWAEVISILEQKGRDY